MQQNKNVTEKSIPSGEDIFEKLEDYMNYSSIEKFTYRFYRKSKLIGRVCHFSDENIHSPDKTTELSYDLEDSFLLFHYWPLVKANHLGEDGRGYVSIIFQNLRLTNLSALSINVCVIDSYKEERFRQTYIMVQDADGVVSPTTIDKFISRETLLREPDEFLQHDCLTLQIECNCEFESSPFHEMDEQFRKDYVRPAFVIKKSPGEEEKICLRLDSEVARCLSEVSPMFQGATRNKMLENKQGYIEIPQYASESFEIMFKIVMKFNTIEIGSFNGFYQLILLADYYLIGKVTDVCRDILKCFLLSKDANLRESVKHRCDIARNYCQDEREILERLLNDCRKSIADEEFQNEATSHTDTAGNTFIDEWVCSINDVEPIVTLKVVKKYNDHFDFYQ